MAKLEWFTAIAEYYTKVLDFSPVTNIGAFIDDQNYLSCNKFSLSISHMNYFDHSKIIWTHEFRDMDLYVLKIRSSSPQNTQYVPL